MALALATAITITGCQPDAAPQQADAPQAAAAEPSAEAAVGAVRPSAPPGQVQLREAWEVCLNAIYIQFRDVMLEKAAGLFTGPIGEGVVKVIKVDEAGDRARATVERGEGTTNVIFEFARWGS